MIIKIINFIPLIAFFITYKMTSNMITATAVILGGCIIASVLEFLISKKISRMQIFLTVAVIIFGLPTILLNDPQIIKWKVTVVNFLLAGAIFVCQIILKKNPFSYLLGQELPQQAFFRNHHRQPRITVGHIMPAVQQRGSLCGLTAICHFN